MPIDKDDAVALRNAIKLSLFTQHIVDRLRRPMAYAFRFPGIA